MHHKNVLTVMEEYFTSKACNTWKTEPQFKYHVPLSVEKSLLEAKFCSRFLLMQEKVADGPVSWASRNQVSFIAEQVSHHPPGMRPFVFTFNFMICLDLEVLYVWFEWFKRNH